MQVHGSCHCGAIAYEAEVDAGRVAVCHCTDCQKLSASPFRVTVWAREQDFRLLRGDPRIYVKVADSGNRRQQAFCANCGTNIYATSDEPAGTRSFGVRVGPLEESRELTPTVQIWCESAMPWLPQLPGAQTARDR